MMYLNYRHELISYLICKSRRQHSTFKVYIYIYKKTNREVDKINTLFALHTKKKLLLGEAVPYMRKSNGSGNQEACTWVQVFPVTV